MIEEDYKSTMAVVGEDRDLVLCCAYKGPVHFNYHFEKKVRIFGFLWHSQISRQNCVETMTS